MLPVYANTTRVEDLCRVSLDRSILFHSNSPRLAAARRVKNETLLTATGEPSEAATVRIAALYAIEDEVRGKPADLRLSVRQARAKPLLDDLRKWMEKACLLYTSPSPR